MPDAARSPLQFLASGISVMLRVYTCMFMLYLIPNQLKRFLLRVNKHKQSSDLFTQAATLNGKIIFLTSCAKLPSAFKKLPLEET